LGDFSPIGRLFTLGTFSKNTEVALCLGLLATGEKLMYYFGKKWVEIHFGYFLITHLVTLIKSYLHEARILCCATIARHDWKQLGMLFLRNVADKVFTVRVNAPLTPLTEWHSVESIGDDSIRPRR
jgi:hypothetical protein